MLGLVRVDSYRLIAVLLALILLVSAACSSEGGEETTAPFWYTEIVDTSKAEYTYEEMEEDLFLLAAQYPELVRVASAGKSLDGREIYYADIGAADAPRQIMVNAGIHGREYMTPMLLMELAEQLLLSLCATGTSGEAVGADSWKQTSFRLVPMVNPDGVTISQKGLAGIRSESLRDGIVHIFDSDKRNYGYGQHYATIEEYLIHWKANAAGVDLNRNFGIGGWEKLQTGIVHPSSQRYKGSAPNSEPETQALMRLTESMQGLVCSISLHSQGEILYWDCGQTGTVRAQTIRLAEQIHRMNGYRLQQTFEQADASYNDWCCLHLGIPSLNIETGVDACPLPIEQFSTIWEQNQDLLWILMAFGEQEAVG